MDKSWRILLDLFLSLGNQMEISKLLALFLDLMALPTINTSILQVFIYLFSALILIQEAFLGTMTLTPIDLLAASPAYTVIRNAAYPRQVYEGFTRNSYEDWNVCFNTTELDCSLVTLQASICMNEKAGEAVTYVAEQAVIVGTVLYESACDGAQEAASYIGENAGPAAEHAKDAAWFVGEKAVDAAYILGDNTQKAAAYISKKGAAYISEKAGPAAELAKDMAYSVGQWAASYLGVQTQLNSPISPKTH